MRINGNKGIDEAVATSQFEISDQALIIFDES